ncbi:MAG TPA: efflux RND transporter periplasmic adaptor subunit [Bacteroidia bacterium]|nr:efflux RND transporter periplasmic adaptor subunit [Bacteroidia bacterium]
MKKNWKYGSRSPFTVWLIGMILMCVFSCDQQSKHSHIENKNSTDLQSQIAPVNGSILSSVKTSVVQEFSVSPVVNANGVISYDPNLINNISSRFSGRIEKLYLRYNFQQVQKGQRLMDVYSPEINAEQENLLLLLNSRTDSVLIHSAIEKLRLMGLTDDLVESIIKRKKILNPLPIYSSYSGHIHDIGITNSSSQKGNESSSGMSSMNSNPNTSQPIQIENLPSSESSSLSLKEGMYIQNGQALFAVYATNKVWAILNIFQKDASLVKKGDEVCMIPETNRTDTIHSKIGYIEPLSGENMTAIKVRVFLSDSIKQNLRIGTLLSASIFTFPIKGMWLKRSAVIDLGNKKVVFVKIKDLFIATRITTGFENDSLVQVINGVTVSDQVAENAQFLVDSESFINVRNNEK